MRDIGIETKAFGIELLTVLQLLVFQAKFIFQVEFMLVGTKDEEQQQAAGHCIEQLGIPSQPQGWLNDQCQRSDILIIPILISHTCIYLESIASVRQIPERHLILTMRVVPEVVQPLHLIDVFHLPGLGKIGHIKTNPQVVVLVGKLDLVLDDRHRHLGIFRPEVSCHTPTLGENYRCDLPVVVKGCRIEIAHTIL